MPCGHSRPRLVPLWVFCLFCHVGLHMYYGQRGSVVCRQGVACCVWRGRGELVVGDCAAVVVVFPVVWPQYARGGRGGRGGPVYSLCFAHFYTPSLFFATPLDFVPATRAFGQTEWRRRGWSFACGLAGRVHLCDPVCGCAFCLAGIRSGTMRASRARRWWATM